MYDFYKNATCCRVIYKTLSVAPAFRSFRRILCVKLNRLPVFAVAGGCGSSRAPPEDQAGGGD